MLQEVCTHSTTSDPSFVFGCHAVTVKVHIVVVRELFHLYILFLFHLLYFAFVNQSATTMSSLLSKTTTILLQKNLLHKPAAALAANTGTLQHQHHHQRCFSSNEEPQSQQNSDVFPVYTHHVSKIVLQHLQDARAGWLVEQGLASGLQIKSNGTFLLHFPTRSDGGDGGKIWYVTFLWRESWLAVIACYRGEEFNLVGLIVWKLKFAVTLILLCFFFGMEDRGISNCYFEAPLIFSLCFLAWSLNSFMNLFVRF